mmetsp:Transcript_87476/g.232247  ORF Transcript_87476/g.232247 Transcript_87476/m.232247 type:complete len:309 (-) Transcript_87476:63-989(-)
MATVARWSATTCWNSWFSACRCSLALFSATCAFAMLAFSSSKSCVSPCRLPSRPAIFASRSFFSVALTRVSSSFASMSFWHDSCLTYSSSCCFFSSATILSMASLTFSKPSNCTPTASAARRKPPEFPAWRRAAARICEAACARWCCRSRPAMRCNWVPLPPLPLRWCCLPRLSVWRKLMVAEKRSRASSSVRICTASAIAWTSSVLVLLRSAYAASALEQRSFRSMRNFSSALSAPRVSSTSIFACATFKFVPDKSALFSSTDLPLARSSPSLAALRRWKAISASISARCAEARSFSKVSCICWSIP